MTSIYKHVRSQKVRFEGETVMPCHDTEDVYPKILNTILGNIKGNYDANLVIGILEHAGKGKSALTDYLNNYNTPSLGNFWGLFSQTQAANPLVDACLEECKTILENSFHLNS